MNENTENKMTLQTVAVYSVATILQGLEPRARFGVLTSRARRQVAGSLVAASFFLL